MNVIIMKDMNTALIHTNHINQKNHSSDNLFVWTVMKVIIMKDMNIAPNSYKSHKS